VDRLCLVCRRIEGDPIHDPLPRQRLAGVVPRIEQHAYDPGERRRSVRRQSDREVKE
jgi:hypothetical protein